MKWKREKQNLVLETTEELQREEIKSRFKSSIWRFGLQPLFVTEKAANSPDRWSAKHEQVIVDEDVLSPGRAES